MTATYEDTLAYLERYYLTMEQLAERSGLPPGRISALIDSGLMPGHSHEATFRLTVYARVNGDHATADRRVRYYHPDLVELAAEAEAAAEQYGPAEAAVAIRHRHDEAVRQASSLRPEDPALQALADDAWSVWRDGTIGVCLRRFSSADIVRKTEAVETMAAALQQAAAKEPASVDHRALAAALEAYATVASPFGPHERDGSTRARVYEPALALASRIERDAA